MMTLYFRAVGPAVRAAGDLPTLDVARPDGLWARVLAAVGPGPSRLCQIHRAAAPRLPVESGRVRKHRTARALFALVDLGLIARSPDGYRLTAAGQAALAACQANAVREARAA